MPAGWRTENLPAVFAQLLSRPQKVKHAHALGGCAWTHGWLPVRCASLVYVIKKTQQTLDKHKLACRSKMAKDCMAHTCFCQMLLLHMLPEQKITSSPAPSATISHTKNTTWGSTSKLMNCHPRLTNVLLAMCWSTPGSFSGNTNLCVRSSLTTRCKTCHVPNKMSLSA